MYDLPSPSGRSRALLVAAGLAFAGVVGGLVSVLTVPALYDLVAAPESLVGRLLGRYVVQPGFGAVALLYVLTRADRTPYLRTGGFSAEAVGWLAVGVALEPVTRTLSEVAFGATHAGGTPKWALLLAEPTALPAAVAVTFLVMAPAEELLYRGVVHGRLRGHFGPAGRVLTSATLFGLLHLVLSGGVPSFLVTGLSGLALGTAYERTDDLAVPVCMHAGFWLLGPL